MYSERVNLLKFACFRRRYIKKISIHIANNAINQSIYNITFNQPLELLSASSDNGSMICEPDHHDYFESESDSEYIIFEMSDLER